MTIPTKEEIVQACRAHVEGGGQLISGHWGSPDPGGCACALTALCHQNKVELLPDFDGDQVADELSLDLDWVDGFIHGYDHGGEAGRPHTGAVRLGMAVRKELGDLVQ